MHLSVRELLHFTDEERHRWEQWFRENGDGLLRMPIAGESGATVGALILRIYGVELGVIQLLRGEPLSEEAERPYTRLEEVFGFGLETRKAMREFVHSAREQDWTRIVTFILDSRRYRATARRLVLYALLEELRRWAQLERIMWERGFEPPPNNGLLTSSALI